MKFSLHILGKPGDGTHQRWPSHLFGGRVRTSTLVLIVVFLVVWWLYDTYRPHEPAHTGPPPTQVVPPGFVPDPNYTWVPRTRVDEPPPTYTAPRNTAPWTKPPSSTLPTTTSSLPPTTTTPPPPFTLPPLPPLPCLLPPPFCPDTTTPTTPLSPPPEQGSGPSPSPAPSAG